MSLITQEKAAAVTKWLHEELWPELQLVFSNNQYLKYLLILLAVLILILIRLRKKRETYNTPNEKSSCSEPEGGYKNFKGDKWYPDGRIWHEDKKAWDDPDYSKK